MSLSFSCWASFTSLKAPFTGSGGTTFWSPHVDYANSGFILVENLLKLFLSHPVHFFTVLEYIVKAPVPHDAPIHGFANIPDGHNRVLYV